MKSLFEAQLPVQPVSSFPLENLAEINRSNLEAPISEPQAGQRRLRHRNRATDVAVLRKSLFAAVGKGSFTIEANGRPGNPKRIVITIADVSHLKLTQENLSEIFRLANQHTLNKPYPLGDWPMRIGDLVAYRPNHNGTHSARQTACIDALFDLLMSKGDANKKSIFNSLTDEEKMNLRLAAYFLRSGRVDESKITEPPADNYNARSALIYESYAKQLGVSSKTIDWTKKLIFYSCKPNRPKDFDADPKNKLGYTFLSLVHELDLVRCYSPEKMEDPMSKIKKHLGYFISDSVKRNRCMEQLIQYSKDLCQATGCNRVFDNAPGNRNLFMSCSTDGAYCWKAVKGIPIPKWM